MMNPFRIFAACCCACRGRPSILFMIILLLVCAIVNAFTGHSQGHSGYFDYHAVIVKFEYQKPKPAQVFSLHPRLQSEPGEWYAWVQLSNQADRIRCLVTPDEVGHVWVGQVVGVSYSMYIDHKDNVQYENCGIILLHPEQGLP